MTDENEMIMEKKKNKTEKMNKKMVTNKIKSRIKIKTRLRRIFGKEAYERIQNLKIFIKSKEE